TETAHELGLGPVGNDLQPDRIVHGGSVRARGGLCCPNMTEPRNEHLTAGQRQALASELAELEGPKRTAAVHAIKTAREHGDLSENFEYHAAKNEQGLLEARIRTLRSRLDHSVLVDESALTHDKAAVGSMVEIEDENGEQMKLEIS